MAARSDALLPAFAGFFFALALAADARERGMPPDLLERVPDPLARPRQLDADSLCVRDLRRLPAIGPARALAIVRARAEHGLAGGPDAWERIPGIGPETVRAARAWLAAASRGATPSRPPAALSGDGRGAYTSPGRRP